MAEYQQRICAGCQQVDDHPRHGNAGEGALPWHMDCHVLATGCEICAEQLANCDTSTKNDGVIGDELRKRLLTLPTTVKEH